MERVTGTDSHVLFYICTRLKNNGLFGESIGDNNMKLLCHKTKLWFLEWTVEIRTLQNSTQKTQMLRVLQKEQ